jgi:hypothetical protein
MVLPDSLSGENSSLRSHTHKSNRDPPDMQISKYKQKFNMIAPKRTKFWQQTPKKWKCMKCQIKRKVQREIICIFKYPICEFTNPFFSLPGLNNLCAFP